MTRQDKIADNTRSRSKSEKANADATESQSIPLRFIKELLSVQESSMKSFFSAYMDSTNVRIDNLIKEVRDLKASLEFTQSQVEELRQLDCDKFGKIQDDIENLSLKADDLENRTRRNNLCFDGIPEESESQSESWRKSEEKVLKILNDKMELPGDIKIERAHRVGTRRQAGKPRSIVVKFLSYKDRERVMKERRKLKGTRVFVREDYSDRIAETRRQLYPDMLEARRNGKIAYLNYNKLIVYDRPTRAFGFRPGFGRNWQDYNLDEVGNLNATSEHLQQEQDEEESQMNNIEIRLTHDKYTNDFALYFNIIEVMYSYVVYTVNYLWLSSLLFSSLNLRIILHTSHI